MDLKDKRVLVVGIARSGIACVKLLDRLGAKVVVSDQKTADQLEESLAALSGIDVEYHLGTQPDNLVPHVALVVFSPGAPPDSPFLIKARQLGIPTWVELELAYRYCAADIVGITGTNGKTTTTALTAQIFQDGGVTAYALGNIGIPLAHKALDMRPGDVVAAEVSAHQLLTTLDFHPRVAMLLNLTEDHINWFGSLRRYFDAKAHIFKNQTPQDFAVLNYEDPEVRAMADRTAAKVLYFAHAPHGLPGAWEQEGVVWYDLDDGAGARQLCRCDEVRIPGGHNLENAMAAALAALALGISPASVRHTLMTFAGVEHRIETVREKDGIVYINDSKGTNPDATIKAIQAMNRPTALILGGSDKKSDFTEMVHAFGDTVRQVVVLGVTADQIAQTCLREGFADVTHAADMEDAVKKATALLPEGGAVLLSPACASFDMFRDFEHRGRVFKEIVGRL